MDFTLAGGGGSQSAQELCFCKTINLCFKRFSSVFNTKIYLQFDRNFIQTLCWRHQVFIPFKIVLILLINIFCVRVKTNETEVAKNLSEIM